MFSLQRIGAGNSQAQDRRCRESRWAIAFSDKWSRMTKQNQVNSPIIIVDSAEKETLGHTSLLTLWHVLLADCSVVYIYLTLLSVLSGCNLCFASLPFFHLNKRLITWWTGWERHNRGRFKTSLDQSIFSWINSQCHLRILYKLPQSNNPSDFRLVRRLRWFFAFVSSTLQFIHLEFGLPQKQSVISSLFERFYEC